MTHRDATRIFKYIENPGERKYLELDMFIQTNSPRTEKSCLEAQHLYKSTSFTDLLTDLRNQDVTSYWDPIYLTLKIHLTTDQLLFYIKPYTTQHQYKHVN